MAWSMTRASAPATVHERTEVPPTPTVEGVAEKDVMTGGAAGIHSPDQQIRAVAHAVPSGLLPLSTHTGVAVVLAHVVAPVLHEFDD